MKLITKNIQIKLRLVKYTHNGLLYSQHFKIIDLTSSKVEKITPKHSQALLIRYHMLVYVSLLTISDNMKGTSNFQSKTIQMHSSYGDERNSEQDKNNYCIND